MRNDTGSHHDRYMAHLGRLEYGLGWAQFNCAWSHWLWFFLAGMSECAFDKLAVSSQCLELATHIAASCDSD